MDTIGPYHVIRRLGVGGMGEVFLADDPRLGRQVAIKRPTDAWLATTTARERLRREARAAAQLTHPNIAAIYDVLDDHDRPHIVMEYVEGETLAAVMMGGPISAARVAEIGEQLAAALVAAHARGIIHRDLKLGNAMLTADGRVKVLDFGLATSSQGSGEERLTDTGRAFGTPGYMSPEQVLGYRGDERSDIYSVGVMLFALISGRLPFQNLDSGGQALTMLTGRDTPRADAVNPAVPAPAADVIARAMARDPEDRFQSAADLRDALSRLRRVLAELPTGPSEAPTGGADVSTNGRRRALTLVAAIGAGLALLFAVTRWRASQVPSVPAPVTEVPVVAVLPFEVISNDPANAYLGVGFADSLTTELAQLPDVTVVRRDELRDFTGDRRDLRRAATAVGANLVVDASVQVQKSTLRVNVTVYRAEGGRFERIAASSREGSTERLFDLQHDLAAGVIDGAKLGAVAATTQALGTTNPVAQTKYWQGRALLDRTDVPGNLEQAMAAFQAALQLDGSFAQARAALGEAAWQRYKDTKDTQWVAQALSNAEAAVRQDPKMADAYVSLAIVYQGTGKPADAIAALRKAIALQPSHDNAHEVLGDALFTDNQKTEALVQFREAIRLRPRVARHYARLGVAELRLSQFDAAIAALKTAIDLQPDNADTLHLLGATYQLAGDSANALATYQRAIALKPVSQAYSNIGMIQYQQGDFLKAAQSFEQAAALKPNEPQIHYNLADAYRRLGEAGKARSEYLVAVDELEGLLKINPRDSRKMGLLAVCLAKVGRTAEARDRVAAAVGISPNDGEVVYRRAVVQMLAGDTTSALASLDAALTNGYSAKSAEHDDDLQRLADTPAFRAVIAKHRQS